MDAKIGPVLSVHRPWAGGLVDKWKPIENRSRNCHYRGRLYIHAGQKWDQLGQHLAEQNGIHVSRAEPSGFIIGTVDVVGSHRANDCCQPWGFPDCWHWELANPVRFPEPIPAIGRQGLYRVNTDTTTPDLAQLAF